MSPSPTSVALVRPPDRRPRRLVAAWRRVPRPLRQVLVGLLGTAVLVVGAAMIVLPGPALVVLPLGLAILATEFDWARHLLVRVKRLALAAKRAVVTKARGRKRRRSPLTESVGVSK